VVWKKVNGFEKKLWAIIILLVANLAGVLAGILSFLVKAAAK